MTRFGWTVGAAFLAMASLLSEARWARSANSPIPERTVVARWEYRIEPKVGTTMDQAGRGDHQYQKLFDTLGADGWEFVGSFGGSIPGAPLGLVFRRPN
ncbi:MAG TPA: hypothetical protein VKU80_17470 [Planctomycetota bacterium]|nr:hypothetical protein [Planctomycetota bacterium]